MRGATGRSLDDLAPGVDCLLAYAGHTDPTPEARAGAAIIASMAVDLHLLVKAWS